MTGRLRRSAIGRSIRTSKTTARLAVTLASVADLPPIFVRNTADSADLLKEANGSWIGGRKCSRPVYRYSITLSQEDAPSDRLLKLAVKKPLEELGLDDHEAKSDFPGPLQVLMRHVANGEISPKAVPYSDRDLSQQPRLDHSPAGRVLSRIPVASLYAFANAAT